MSLFFDTIEENISVFPEFLKQHPNGPYFVSYETFVIRLRFDVNKWILSTKKKDNAFASFWAERRSFGNLFLDEIGVTLEKFTEHLDKAIEYYFLVPLRGKNRVLLTKEQEKLVEPLVFLAGVVTAERSYIFETEEQRELFRGPWSFLPLFDPEDSIENYPLSIGISYISLGAKQCPEFEKKDGDSKRLVRFLPTEYQQLRSLRNNTADIYIRYGQLWSERSPNVDLYRRHYSEYIGKFDKAIDEIYEEYKSRYVFKELVTTTQLRHAILKKVREIQIKRQWITVSKNNVYSVVFKHFSGKLFKV